MEIASVQTALHRLPPSSHWEDATVQAPVLEFISAEVRSTEDVFGTGLAYTVGLGGSAIRSLIDDYCAPLIVGHDPARPEHVWATLWQNLNRVARGGVGMPAIAAIDIAVWDLLGKARGEPLHRMLGGARSDAEVYASGIDAHLSPDELQVQLAETVARGYRAVKIKVGLPTLRLDLARLTAAREVLGDEIQLMIDANARWRLDEALERGKAFERFQPYWLEEPLEPGDIDGHRRLRRAIGTPIAVGESLHSSAEFREYLRRDAVDILQPDVVRVGGITPWLKVTHMAEAWCRPVAPHYLAELSAHLVCGAPNGILVEEVRGGGLAEIGLARGGLTVAGGRATPTAQPGHGIVLNRGGFQQGDCASGRFMTQAIAAEAATKHEEAV